MDGKFNKKELIIAIKCTSKKYNMQNVYSYKSLRIGHYYARKSNIKYEFFVIDNGKFLEIVVAKFGFIISEGDF